MPRARWGPSSTARAAHKGCCALRLSAVAAPASNTKWTCKTARRIEISWSKPRASALWWTQRVRFTSPAANWITSTHWMAGSKSRTRMPPPVVPAARVSVLDRRLQVEPSMTDYFALFDEPRRLWLDPERLKTRFLALSAELHPDKIQTITPADR